MASCMQFERSSSQAAFPAKSANGGGGAAEAETTRASDRMSTHPASGTEVGSTCQSVSVAGEGLPRRPCTRTCSTFDGSRRSANNRWAPPFASCARAASAAALLARLPSPFFLEGVVLLGTVAAIGPAIAAIAAALTPAFAWKSSASRLFRSR